MTLQRFERRQRIFKIATLIALVVGWLWIVFGRSLQLSRVFVAVLDVPIMIAYYFCQVFHLPFSPPATVNAIPVSLDIFLPYSWSEFAARMGDYIPTFFSAEGFFGYLSFILRTVSNVMSFVKTMIPFVIVLLIVLLAINYGESDKVGDSRMLKLWKRIRSLTFKRVRVVFRQYKYWIRPRRRTWITFVIIALIGTNVATIALEFVAWFFYFAGCFDILGLYIQVVRLAIDVWIMLGSLPWYIWAIIGYVVFNRIRCYVGHRRLKEYQKANSEFVKELPLAVMITGTMGANKTTFLTAMLIECQDMFRREALDRMYKIHMRYPAFPIEALERDIRSRVDSGKIKALRDIRKYIRKRAAEYDRHPDAARCYGYEVESYAATFDDKLTVRKIFRDLEEYACLFYIYNLDCSLMLTSYAVRGDGVREDKGHFALWKMNALKRDPSRIEEDSQYSKILNYDFVRLGRRMDPLDVDALGFEFGILGVTELGKERQNTLELTGVKKSEQRANQKNDYFNLWLKTGRHPSTVDYFPFFRFFGDDQRASSWGADARDTAQIVNVRKAEKIRCELPFVGFTKKIYKFAAGPVKRFFYDCRVENERHTLSMHIVKSIVGAISRRYERIYNEFGVIELQLELESGDLEGEKTPGVYYLLPKIIYADRFATDCYRGYYAERGKHARKGMRDYDAYKSLDVNFDTLQKHRSYLNNMMMGLFPEDPSEGVESHEKE